MVWSWRSVQESTARLGLPVQISQKSFLLSRTLPYNDAQYHIIGCTSHHINLNFCLLCLSEHDGLHCLCIFVYVCLFFAFFLYLSLCKDFLYRKETTGLNGVGATKTGIETVTSTETRIETVTSTETVIDGAMMTASDPGTRISTSRTMSGTTKNSGMLVC